MRENERYCIIRGRHWSVGGTFESDVARMIEAGWVPTGGVCKEDRDDRYAQAMWKPAGTGVVSWLRRKYKKALEALT